MPTDDPQPEVFRITSASASRSHDQEQRIGRYLASMLIRTICVVLVLVVHGPFRWVFAVGAIVLPYIAVIIANNSGIRRDRPPTTLGGPPAPQPQPLAPSRPVQVPAEDVITGEVVSGSPVPHPAAGDGRTAA